MSVRNIKRVFLFFVVTSLLSTGMLFMTGCGEQSRQDTTQEKEEKTEPQKPAVESLEFQKVGTTGTETEMEQGVRKLVGVDVKPVDADVETLKWSSSDEAVAVLEDAEKTSATVFAKAVGEADITCEGPNGVKAVLHVTVKVAPSTDDTAANTYGGKNANDGVGDTSIYNPIESFDVETPDINPVTPNMP